MGCRLFFRGDGTFIFKFLKKYEEEAPIFSYT